MARKVPTEKEIFTRNYSKFCDILKNEDGLLSNLVDKGIIKFDDMDEIRNKPAKEKGGNLLKHISGPLEAGFTDGFYQLIEIMETHGKPDTQKLARKIRKECPHTNNCGTLYTICTEYIRMYIYTRMIKKFKIQKISRD